MKLATYNPDDLRALIAAECGTTPFVANYLAALSRQLDTSPADYLDFGPYWWVVKAMLHRHGYTQFGEELNVEDELLESMVYEDEALTLAAAYTYGAYLFTQGIRHQNVHVLITENGDPQSYLLADPDMEARIVAQQVIRGLRHGALH